MTLSERIAAALHISNDTVARIARNASYRYKTFYILKSDGKSRREINQPSQELKLLQRWVARRIFGTLPTHPSAFAYEKNISIRRHALVHALSKYISRLDLQDFFPSLTAADIEIPLTSKGPEHRAPPLTSEDIKLLTTLTCRFGRLTIGAPSSPTISNKLLFELDVQLSATAERHGAKYTRYADDLYFSSSLPNAAYETSREAETIIAQTTTPHLKVNAIKTRHASHKTRMAITGLLITPQGKISVGRELKRKIRAAAHKAHTKRISREDLSWLLGMLAFVSSVEPGFSERIKAKYLAL